MKINEICPLCVGEFKEIDEKMHQMFDMHKVNNTTWKPEKGHDLKEIHDRVIKLLETLKVETDKNIKLKEKLSKLENSNWWERLFIRAGKI